MLDFPRALRGAKLTYAISNDCKSYFGRGMNLISMSVILCIDVLIEIRSSPGGETDEGTCQGAKQNYAISNHGMLYFVVSSHSTYVGY